MERLSSKFKHIIEIILILWLVGAFFTFIKHQFAESKVCTEYDGKVSGWFWCSKEHFALEKNAYTPPHLSPWLWPLEVLQELKNDQKAPDKEAQPLEKKD